MGAAEGGKQFSLHIVQCRIGGMAISPEMIVVERENFGGKPQFGYCRTRRRGIHTFEDDHLWFRIHHPGLYIPAENQWLRC